MRKTLSFLVILSIAFCASAQTNSKFRRSARQQRTLERSIQRLETEPIQGNIWGTALYSTNDAPWVLNHYLTIPELYAYADTHHCAQVRAVAIWSLMSRKAQGAKELFFRHVTDGTPIEMAGGFCVMNNWTLGDIIFAYANENGLLDERDRLKVDSLLLGSPDAVNMKLRYELLEWLIPGEEELATLRRVSQQCVDPGGLQVLAQYHKPQDTALVLKALDTIYNAIWSNPRPVNRRYNSHHPYRRIENQIVNVANSWQHPAFYRRAEQMCDSLTAKGLVPSENLLRFAFIQDAQQFPALVERTLARLASDTANAVSEQHDRLVAKAVKQISQSMEMKDYAIDGISRHRCCSFIKYDAAMPAAEEATNEILSRYSSGDR